MLIYPVLGILFTSLFMMAVNPIMGVINTAISGALNGLSGTSIVLWALSAPACRRPTWVVPSTRPHMSLAPRPLPSKRCRAI
ncbi:MAG: hypothetical protein ACLRM9_05385 [Collinsella aerofaciens]